MSRFTDEVSVHISDIGQGSSGMTVELPLVFVAPKETLLFR